MKTIFRGMNIHLPIQVSSLAPEQLSPAIILASVPTRKSLPASAVIPPNSYNGEYFMIYTYIYINIFQLVIGVS